MKRILKNVFLKISYNTTLRKIATKVFVYFPTLKEKIISIRNNAYIDATVKKDFYKSDFLTTIKKEIEETRNKG